MKLTPYEAMARLAAAAAVGLMTAAEMAEVLKKATERLRVAFEAIAEVEREERVNEWQGKWLW